MLPPSPGNMYQLEQIAATHGLTALCNAKSEKHRPDFPAGSNFVVGEARPGIVAVQGALALATEANWTNLATFLTRSPAIGEGVESNFDPDEDGEERGKTQPESHYQMNTGIILCNAYGN